MHIEQPDAEFHDDIPPAAQTSAELIAELEAEQAHWHGLLSRLSGDQMQAARRQFNHPESGDQNVRWFVMNALQNVIYNHGQLVVLYLALSAPGASPCAPPLPQVYYEQLRKGWGQRLGSGVARRAQRKIVAQARLGVRETHRRLCRVALSRIRTVADKTRELGEQF